MGRSAEIEAGNRRLDEAEKLRQAASQLHKAQQALIRRNVQIKVCMQAIIDKAYRLRDRPHADAFDETEANGAIDAICQLAYDLGIEGEMNVASDSDDWCEFNSAAALDWLTTVWTTRCNEAARKEGWAIWDCDGSENAPWQICKFDSPDEADSGELAEDADAWRLVCEGTGEHHQLAREFLTMFVPSTELKFIGDWYAKEST